MTTEKLFPYEGFPIRLEYDDNGDKRTCWFQTQFSLDKHLSKYVKTGKYDVQYHPDYRHDKPHAFISAVDIDESPEVSPSTDQPVKRKRGRPRKNPIQEPKTTSAKPKPSPFSDLNSFFQE